MASLEKTTQSREHVFCFKEVRGELPLKNTKHRKSGGGGGGGGVPEISPWLTPTPTATIPDLPERLLLAETPDLSAVVHLERTRRGPTQYPLFSSQKKKKYAIEPTASSMMNLKGNTLPNCWWTTTIHLPTISGLFRSICFFFTPKGVCRF